jgi:WD40 repeat protein
MNRVRLLLIVLLLTRTVVSIGQNVLASQDISVKALEFSSDKKYVGWVHLNSNEIKVISLDSTWSINLGSSSGGIRCLTFHPVEPKIAIGFYNGTIEMWNFRQGQLLWTVKAHEKQVNDLKISKHGNFLISVSNDKTIRCFWLDNGDHIITYEHSSMVNSVELHPHNHGQFVTGDHDGNVIYWKLNSGKKIKLIEAHESYVHDLAFFPGGDTLISASHDKTVKAWAYNSGRLLKVFKGHTRTVFTIDIVNQSQIVTGSFDCTVCLWNFNSGDMQHCYRGHTDYINVVRVTANGDIVSGSRDGTLRLWKH